MLDARTRNSVAAGMVGTVLEWFDFAIYGFFAVAIGRQFFPAEDPLAQLLAAFGVFAIGYLARPVGGVVVGHIGDRIGRRAALVIAIAAMAVPTFLIGILPGYDTLGILAPLALIVLRMIQGLSLGGEFPSSMVFLVERAPPGRRGVMGALAACGAVAGILLGSGTGAVLASLMSADALNAWGWRIPFVLGLGIGVAGALLRRHVEESVPARCTGPAPIVDTVRNHWRLVARITALTAFNAVPFYLVFVYLVSWMQVIDGFTPAQALEINTAAMGALIPVMLAAAWLSDRYGRRPLLLFATALGLVGAWPLFTLMAHPDPAMVFLGQLGAGVFIGTFNAVLPAFLAEQTPAHVRCTAVALGYNLCIGIVGGLTPFMAALLVDWTASPLSPAVLLMGAAALSFVAVALSTETHRAAFEAGVPMPARSASTTGLQRGDREAA